MKNEEARLINTSTEVGDLSHHRENDAMSRASQHTSPQVLHLTS